MIVDLATDERATRYGRDFPARETHVIPSATIRGRNPVALARTVVTLGIGAMKALRLMRRIRPVAVVGFGGYPTVPPLLAATLRRIPTVIHDANAVMGRANRLLAPRVSAIATSFPEHHARRGARRQGDVHRQSDPADGAGGSRAALSGARGRRAGSACWCSAAARARA